jgi:hypothetical protein
MSFLDKIKPASDRGTDNTQADARDSVYEAVHLDTQGQDGQSSVHARKPKAPATTGFAEVGVPATPPQYSTMEPLGPSAAAAPRPAPAERC